MFIQMKLGCLPPKHDPRTLRLSKYLTPAQLPAPPAQADWQADVKNWPMMGNDQYGCCTIAAVGHLIQLWSTANGSPVVPSDKDVVDQYFALSGGQDTGLALLDVMNAWRKTGLLGNQIKAYAAVNVQDQAEVEACTAFFGGIITGVQLPLAWQGTTNWQAPARRPFLPWVRHQWQVGSWGGHSIPIGAFNAAQQKGVSWAQEVTISWPAFDNYFVEAYVALDPSWTDGTKAAPSGFDLNALLADLQAIGAN